MQQGRDRGLRSRRREPLPLREDRGGRRGPLRGHRDDRRRRPGDDPRRGQEPQARGRRRGPVRLRRGARGDPRDRRHAASPTRERLAARAFSRTAAYDAAIAGYFAARRPRALHVPGEPRLRLRPRRGAALRREPAPAGRALRRSPRRRRTRSSASRCSRARSSRSTTSSTSTRPSPSRATSRARRRVIVKHNNPCGAGIGDTISEAFGRAFACDPLAAFGGIIAIRGQVDGALASLVLQHFVEVVAADDFTRRGPLLLREEAEHPAAEAPRLAPPRAGPRLEAHRGRPAPAGRGRRARARPRPGRSSRSASPRPSSGRPASSPGRSCAASSRTRS